jgi:hypothetical protein
MRSSIAVTLVLLASAAFGAQQLVPTKTLLVKNPPSGARKVLWKVRDSASAATLVGDPTTDGARLRLLLDPNGGDQCVTLPASGWAAVGAIGFKYKDASLANGPVKVAIVKKTPSGTFLLKALLKNGGPTSITVVPGNPSTNYATNFALGTGDEYCGGTATATPDPDDAVTFKVSNDGAPASCAPPCNATTTTTSTSLPSNCSTLGEPCGACGDGICRTDCETGQLVCARQGGSCPELGNCATCDAQHPCVSDGPACASPHTFGCCLPCDVTTTTIVTTTTSLPPSCSTLGEPCGACGDGICRTDCESGQLVCARQGGNCPNLGNCAVCDGQHPCVSDGPACASPFTFGCCLTCP